MRGYTFNINSGAVESLELDSFGISLIPSSLVGGLVFLLLIWKMATLSRDCDVVHFLVLLKKIKKKKIYAGMLLSMSL